MDTNEMDVVRADAVLLAVCSSVLSPKDRTGWDQLNRDVTGTAIFHEEVVDADTFLALIKFHLADEKWDFNQRGSVSEDDWADYEEGGWKYGV